MKQTLRTLVLLSLCYFTAMPLFAGFGDVVDFGEMQLDKEYLMKGDYSDYIGHFKASKEGTLVVSSTSSGSFMTPYTDAEHTQPLSYDVSMTQNGISYELEVKEGNIVYFYANFCMNDATITLSMGEHAALTLLESSPAAGSTYSLSGSSLISLAFNKYVSIGSAAIVVGDELRPVVANVYGANVSIDAKSTIQALTSEGLLHSGETFSLVLKDVTANNGQLRYGTDGSLTIQYVLGDMPVYLINTKVLADSTFLSYWPQGDERARIVLTFDGDLQPVEQRRDEAVAIISYGDLDTGDYYQEKVPYTVAGNTLTADFSGVFRRPIDMVSSGTNYKEINVKIAAVRDAKGNYTYTAGSGSLGAYSFSFPYVEVKADVIADFFPTSGSSLKGVDEIEMWITDYKMLRHDGPVFVIADEEGNDTIAATDYSVTEDTDYPGAYLLLIAVPEKVKQAKGEVLLTLKNVQCANGVDYSADLTARYTTAVSDAIATLPCTTTSRPKAYDLKGKAIPQSRLQKGIFIVDGKKIMKK